MSYRKLLLIPLIGLILTGCKREEKLKYDVYDDSKYSAKVDSEGYTLIDFYALNDFHGALENDSEENIPGIGQMNTFLKNERAKNPGGTVLIANGDMWQGSAESNLTKGQAVNHALNHMGYAAMILGNHEFDWGIETIKTNKEAANFPYLGINIVHKDSQETVDFVDESPLIERDGVKIGIIGTMGSDLEDTVQASLISGLEFAKITDYVASESARLRAAGANLVVLAAHDTWISKVDNERSPIVQQKMVDAVFTGHQHQVDEQLINGVPILQARSYGKDVQHVQLAYHKTNNSVKLVESGVIKNIAALDLAKDTTSEKIYSHFYKQFDIGTIKNEKLGEITNRTMSRQKVASFVVEVMAKEYASEVVGAFHNVNGGIRAEFKEGPITYGDVYQAFPFDNELYFVRLSGRMITNLVGGNYAYYWNVDRSTLEPSTFYYVVTTNFVYDLMWSSVANPPSFINQFTYPRDIVAAYIRTHQIIDGGAY